MFNYVLINLSIFVYIDFINYIFDSIKITDLIFPSFFMNGKT